MEPLLRTVHSAKPCCDTASCNPATLLGGVFPILQTRKLKPVEVKSLPRGHTALRWWYVR